MLQTPSLCFSLQGGRSRPIQNPVVVTHGLWLDLGVHANHTGWVNMLDKMLIAGARACQTNNMVSGRP